VSLCTTTVVWLESTLRHGDLLLLVEQSLMLGTQAAAVPYAEQPVKSTPNDFIGQVIEAVFAKSLDCAINLQKIK
jgi:hypothetical protein